MRISHAVISAGGFGTRLRPYTDTMPKPMIPILGKPMLQRSIEHFKKHGVTDFFLTLHYLPEVIVKHFGDGEEYGVKMHYFVENEPLGAAGGIKQFEKELNDQFYFMYGDMLTLVDYTKMSEEYGKKESPIGMQRVARTDEYKNADVAEVDEGGRFIAVHAKPHNEVYKNAYRMRGSFILEKRILSFVPVGTKFDVGGDLLPKVLAAGENFYAYECDDYSKGIDTVEAYKDAEAQYGLLVGEVE